MSVSLLTITQLSRNKCILNLCDFIKDQTYKNIIEWVIVEGSPLETDAELNKDFIMNKLSSLSNIPIKYIDYQLNSKLSDLRNIGNMSCNGDIIVCLDDDDYYFPERVEDAVIRLQNSSKQIAGCSNVYMYHYVLNKLYQFNSFGKNHSTNNCFAYKKEYLLRHSHKPGLIRGEEMSFTNDFTEPMIQLDPHKCIIVSSHNSNTFDKTVLCVKENKQIREITNIDEEYMIFPSKIRNKIKESIFL
jgi:glycosyltransferase involved in cell wall biosynthesis